MLSLLFSRRWFIVTFLAIGSIAVMVRLGFWQLDRLEQRRAFNTQVLAMRDAAPLDLNQTFDLDLTTQVYRMAYVEGEYDFANQIVLSNQQYRDRLGVHLLTPLKISGTDSAILVDRGWVPWEDFQNQTLSVYNQPDLTRIEGLLIGTQDKIGARSCLDESSNTGSSLVVWCVDLTGISASLSYTLPHVYLVRPPTADEGLPIGTTAQIEITEGPHLGYAIQWFSFAALLLVGYPYFVARESRARLKQDDPSLVHDQNHHLPV